MKKLVLATAVAALSVTAAQADPTVYGIVGAQLEYVDNGDGEDSDVQLDNEDTRFGVKGGEALTENTDLIYQLEYALDVTEEEGAQFESRDTYLGLANDQLGTLKAGRLSTIDDNIDFSNQVEAYEVELSFNEPRVNNSVIYMTPEVGGLQGMAHYAVDGEVSKNDQTGDFGQGTYGVGAKYEGDMVALGATYYDVEDSSVDTATRVSGAVDLTPNFQVNGLYQITDFTADNTEKENGFAVGAVYDVMNSPWELNAQYNNVTDFEGTKDNDMNGFSVGGDYYFNKKTKFQLYAGMEDWDNEEDQNVKVGTGLVHKF